jgi:hypothetical protein
MKNVIHHIRKQPEDIRRHILHVLTGVFAVILALIWIYTLGSNLTNTNTQVKIGQDLKPFSAIKDNMEGGFNSITQPDSNASSSGNLNTTDTNTDSSGASTDPNADLKTQEDSM